MEQQSIRLHPENYYHMNEELIFYIGDKVSLKYNSIIDQMCKELKNADVLIICSHIKNERYENYSLLLPNFLLNFKESPEKNNLQVIGIATEKRLKEKKKFIYSHGVFTVIPKLGTAVIINQVKTSNSMDTSSDWEMSTNGMVEVLSAITQYFDLVKNVEQINFVHRNMRTNIINHISNYTNYEDIIDMQNAMGNNYIVYDYCNVTGSAGDNKTYSFYSSSFDPESEAFELEARVDVQTNEHLNDELYRTIKGVIVSRDVVESGMEFKINIKGQFDEYLIPKVNGKIYPKINNTQKRVRERVVQSIERDQVESKYMYQLFKDFTTSGYTPQEGWENFKKQLENKEYPPNTSQMEAIKKGIETNDIQLVLGPPGTGKTTVIVSWIDYFIQQNMRVLISSQNNSAVDNVLERAGKNPNAYIVRLGNAEKVQENCHKYLPVEQVRSMSEKYDSALMENQNLFKEDIKRLEEIKLEVLEILKAYDFAWIQINKLEEYQKNILKYASELLKQENGLENKKKDIDHVIEERAQKQIYLYDNSKRNIFIRLFRCAYTRCVKKELSESEKILNQGIEDYDIEINGYNETSKKLQMELTQPQYNKQKNEVKEAITNCRNGMLVIDLKSVYSEDLEDCQLDVSEINTTITNLNILISKCDGEIVKIKKAINALNVWAKALSTKRNDIMTNILIESSNIVGATCIGINSNREFTDVKFDVSIIDEAGQIQIHNAIVPMSRSRKTLMLGDHLQIPPMVNNNMAQMCKDEEVETELLEKSFFEYLFENLKKKDSNTPNLTRLNEQFRMPSNISDVISEWFYECNYHANYDMSKWKPLIPGTKTPLVIVSTSGEKERMEYSENDAKKDYSMGKKVEAALNGPGYANRLEAKIVVDIVEALIKSGVLPTTDSKGRPLEVQDNIGIISAYGKQVRYIRSALSKRNLGLHNDQIYSMCASLDSFQGQERPIIIYSSTRSTNYKGVDKPRVGFMKELRRLNVAFTRCQKQLVIIGDINYLTSCEYQELNEETREPLANKSEKKYSEFISKIVEQAKTSQGEYVDYSKLDQMLGGEE